MVAFVVPVGHSLGPYFSTDATDAQTFNVRIGSRIYDLDYAEYLTWTLAFGIPEKVERRSPTRAQIEEQAREYGLADPGLVFAELMSVGLLVTVVPVESQMQRFAQQYRACVLGVGLGNSAEQLEQFGIGMPEDPSLVVDELAYSLWSLVSAYPSLWDAALELAASIGADQDFIGARALTPGATINLFLEQLPALLVTNCVYIDRSL